MATSSPERVRRALQRVTSAARLELRAAASAATQAPEPWRATLFAVTPLVLAEYAPAASTLALDWFDEIRDAARPPNAFAPSPRLNVTDEDVRATVAALTADMRQVEDDFATAAEKMLADVEAALQKEVASGFWDTVTENAADDPDAVGWQRFARPGACKFCLMLASRGAVFSESTARFAAHATCHCVAGPSYDPGAPKANVVQYVASRRTRTAAERSQVRDYLNDKYPDAPG